MKIDLLSASVLGSFHFNLSATLCRIIRSLIIKGCGHNETESLESLIVSSAKASQLELWKIFNLLKCNISLNLSRKVQFFHLLSILLIKNICYFFYINLHGVTNSVYINYKTFDIVIHQIFKGTYNEDTFFGILNDIMGANTL